jgi:predicted secreted protein
MSKILHRIIPFLGLLATLCLPAQAADYALANIIGYSEDLRYFAFEEFGVQDGSGFAYSSYYVVDLQEDRWVVGTPVHVVAEEEEETLAQIRQRAAEKVAPRLQNLFINVPAQILAATGDGELDSQDDELNFGLPLTAGSSENSGAYSIKIAPVQVATASPCTEWFGSDAIGFSMSVEDFGVAREIHRDKTLPRSRRCPMAYRISSVLMPYQSIDVTRAVVLVSVFSVGFEGLDRRFIIVPLSNSSQNF